MMLDHMEQALNDSIRVVEDTNSRVNSALASLEDPACHQSIVEQVPDEAAANPGFLEEVEKLCRGPEQKRGQILRPKNFMSYNPPSASD